MTEKRIAAKWVSYRDRVLPLRASDVQIIETRRGFYAGALALLEIMMTSLDPGTDPTDADLRKMDDIEEELKDFVEDVKRGRS